MIFLAWSKNNKCIKKKKHALKLKREPPVIVGASIYAEIMHIKRLVLMTTLRCVSGG